MPKIVYSLFIVLSFSISLPAKEYPPVKVKKITDIGDNGVITVTLPGDEIPDVFREMPVLVKGCEHLIKPKGAAQTEGAQEQIDAQKAVFILNASFSENIQLTDVERDPTCFRLHANLLTDEKNQSQAICEIFGYPAKEESWEIIDKLVDETQQMIQVIENESTLPPPPSPKKAEEVAKSILKDLISPKIPPEVAPKPKDTTERKQQLMTKDIQRDSKTQPTKESFQRRQDFFESFQ